MNKRQEELKKLNIFIQDIDKQINTILQVIQWDHIVENPSMVTCKYDPHHRIPPNKREAHEKQCFLISQGYFKEDVLLPDPPNVNAHTLVKFSNTDIKNIIDYAASCDPLFKRGAYIDGEADRVQPLSVERLQCAYSSDVRRAIHDAVVSAVPSCHDLADLALPSDGGEGPRGGASKSRLEVLAELRNMRRRRTKYRVAAKTRNYSHMLRDVINTQMEMYTGVKTEPVDVDARSNSDVTSRLPTHERRDHNDRTEKHTQGRQGNRANDDMRRGHDEGYGKVRIKQERNELSNNSRNQRREEVDYSRSSNKERRRYTEGRDEHRIRNKSRYGNTEDVNDCLESNGRRNKHDGNREETSDRSKHRHREDEEYKPSYDRNKQQYNKQDDRNERSRQSKNERDGKSAYSKERYREDKDDYRSKKHYRERNYTESRDSSSYDSRSERRETSGKRRHGDNRGKHESKEKRYKYSERSPKDTPRRYYDVMVKREPESDHEA